MMVYNVLQALWLVVLVLALGSNQSYATESAEPAAPADVGQDGETQVNDKTPEISHDGDSSNEEKRVFTSSVLGKGLLGGKRSDTPLDSDTKLKRYGFLLGRGLSTDKREPDVDYTGASDEQNDAQYIKRWLGDVYGGGFNLYRRSKRDVPDKRYIQYFGNVLGRGFSVGKRDGSTDNENAGDVPDDVFVPEDDLYHMEPVSTDEGNEEASGETDKRYVDSVPGYRFMFGKRLSDLDDSDDDYKRYINSDVGGRFMFGKRSDDDDGEVDKRYGFMLGRGFSFGKQKDDRDINKRYGFVLGRGFSFGKRDDGEDVNKRYGFVLGKGFSLGKRGDDKRFYGHVLGNGFAVGKRSEMAPSDDRMEGINEDEDMFVVPDGFEPIDTKDKRMGWLMGKGWRTDSRGNKRYGMVLGKGLSFGKRSDETGAIPLDSTYFINEDGNIEVPQKKFVMTQGYRLFRQKPKRYGFVLGKGFSLGKRSEQEGGSDLIEDDLKMDKRYGFLLGRGFSFGKRIPSKSEYGSILGRGFTFGKRSDDKRNA